MGLGCVCSAMQENLLGEVLNYYNKLERISMKLIKTLIVAAVLLLPMAALALESEEQVEYTDALGTGQVKIVQKYLDKGVDINDKYFAWSALQIAANKGQLAVVKMLAEKGADLNYKHPITKMTAFQLAAYDNFPEVVKYLAAKGADINSKMRGNVSILRAVRDTGNTQMADLLVSLGVKDDGCQEEKCN